MKLYLHEEFIRSSNTNAEVQFSKGSLLVTRLQCHYCGVKDLCKIPYYEDEAEFITCPVSCMTFQGFSKSGQKVIVRDCGFFEADECTANKEYENTGATGTLCHCLTDDCNSAEKMRGLSSLLLLTTSIILTAF